MVGEKFWWCEIILVRNCFGSERFEPIIACLPLCCLLDYSSDLVKMMLHTKNQLPRLGGEGDPNFVKHISSSWVKIRLDAENQLPRLPGSASKVCVG